MIKVRIERQILFRFSGQRKSNCTHWKSTAVRARLGRPAISCVFTDWRFSQAWKNVICRDNDCGILMNRIAVLETDDEYRTGEVCCVHCYGDKDKKKPPDVIVLADKHPEAVSWSVPTIS